MIRLGLLLLFVCAPWLGWAGGLVAAAAHVEGAHVVVSGQLEVGGPDIRDLMDVLRAGRPVLVRQAITLVDGAVGVGGEGAIARGERRIKVQFKPHEGIFHLESSLPDGRTVLNDVAEPALVSALFGVREFPLSLSGAVGQGPFRLRVAAGWEKVSASNRLLDMLSLSWLWGYHPVVKGESGVELGRGS